MSGFTHQKFKKMRMRQKIVITQRHERRKEEKRTRQKKERRTKESRGVYLSFGMASLQSTVVLPTPW